MTGVPHTRLTQGQDLGNPLYYPCLPLIYTLTRQYSELIFLPDNELHNTNNHYIGYIVEIWTGDSCLFPSFVTNGNSRIDHLTSSICTNVVVSSRVPSLISCLSETFSQKYIFQKKKIPFRQQRETTIRTIPWVTNQISVVPIQSYRSPSMSNPCSLWRFAFFADCHEPTGSLITPLTLSPLCLSSTDWRLYSEFVFHLSYSLIGKMTVFFHIQEFNLWNLPVDSSTSKVRCSPPCWNRK